VNFPALIMLVVQISVVLTVFAYGLKSSRDDVIFLFRRPSLLARSILSMNIIMPLFAVLATLFYNFHPAVEAVLVALAVSPVTTLLPHRALKGGGTASYAYGMLLTAALLSIIYVPVAMTLFGRYFYVPEQIRPGAIATLVIITVVLPFTAGIAVRRNAPEWAGRIGKPLSTAAILTLVVSVIPVLVVLYPSVASLVSDGTVLVMLAFVLVGLAAGHMLGGPVPDDRTVLALSTAVRHPAVALAIESAIFPEEKLVPAAVFLYVILNIIVSIPYLLWQRCRKKRKCAQFAE
jgi:BASS family bile acid:Na+ symporter